MKSILITTDFSHNSQHTLKYVLELIQDVKDSCSILLLNTYMVPETNIDQIINVNDRLRKSSKEGLEKEQKEALKILKNPNISIRTTSYMGSLKNVVWQLLQKEKFDLVAMGKDGGKHVESVADLLKEYECPLLITYHKDRKAFES